MISMIKVEADLVGASQISFGKPVMSERGQDEPFDTFEERTWMERLHVDDNGEVFIPPNALKNALSECAKYLGERIPGKGKQQYTKNFEAGIMIVEPLRLGIKATSKEVIKERLFVPSDGRRGGKSRVWKNFPTIMNWKAHVEIMVFDPILIAKPEKIHEYLIHTGKFIGLLRFRPRNNGYYRRFSFCMPLSTDSAISLELQHFKQLPPRTRSQTLPFLRSKILNAVIKFP